MPEETQTITIVSGWFNPLHVGHLRMMKHAAELGDYLVVVVNNDIQQKLKKGKIIVPEADRMEIVEALACVDRVVLSVDTEFPVIQTLIALRKEYPHNPLIFANGGDRRNGEQIAEYEICKELNIETRFGIGGDDKPDSSTRINAALGVDKA